MNKSNYNSILRKFKGIHKGKSAIMFATGPSIKSYKPFDGSKECVKIGLNRIYDYKNLSNDLNYYYYGSHYAIDLLHRDKVNLMCKKKGITSLASAYENGQSHKDINRGNISPEDANLIGSIPFENNLSTFTNDPSKYSTLGHSIVFPPLQHILYMGVKTIYLVGCDGGLTDSTDSGNAHMLGWWKKFKEFKDKYYNNVEIISINPVSLKGWFTDEYL